MPTINQYFQFAQLMQAAYAFLDPDAPQSAQSDALKRANTGEFTDTQAEAFLASYEVIDAMPNDLVGFAATLFKDRQSGEYTLAIRGTEPLLSDPADLLDADRDIYLNGIAQNQILSLNNYYQQLIGSGKITASTQLNVTGHSLGGHLALAFSRLFPIATKAVYTYDAPGFLNSLLVKEEEKGTFCFFSALTV